MIKLTSGDIIQSHAEVLVNSVNIFGVMGKGVALAFKKAFPENYKIYKKACDNGELDVGQLLITETFQTLPKYIVNLPTKKHWRYPSRYEYIEEGLKELRKFIIDKNVKFIAIPPLGAGNGKLDWNLVKKMIDKYLGDITEVDILVYEPSYIPINEISKEKPNLTSSRAILLNLFKEYLAFGYELNLLAAQKLTYFMQRFGEELNLRFERGYYGPYADNLNHVLKVLNGYYIDYNPDNTNPSTTIELNKEMIQDVENFIKGNLDSTQCDRMDKSIRLIDGFQTPFSMEILATVDFILQNEESSTKETILRDIGKWTTRKKELIKTHHIDVAYDRLMEFKESLYEAEHTTLK